MMPDIGPAGLEDGDSSLGSRILRLHVIQIRDIVLSLVIVLRQASHVRGSSG